MHPHVDENHLRNRHSEQLHSAAALFGEQGYLFSLLKTPVRGGVSCSAKPHLTPGFALDALGDEGCELQNQQYTITSKELFRCRIAVIPNGLS